MVTIPTTTAATAGGSEVPAMGQDVIDRLALELDEAEQSRQPIEQISKRYPQMTIEDGYRIGSAWVRRKLARGRTVRGHKIGLTSRAMQQSVGISEPDYGTLLDDMFFDTGGEIPLDRFISPKVEVELAFVLGKPLKGPGVTLFDVLGATDYVMPAVEIVDSRVIRVDPVTGTTRGVRDTISDNAANAGVILGGRPVRPFDCDLRWVSALMTRNGVIEETGVSAGVLNHPANGIVWLVNKLARFDQGLAAGEVVLGGSFTRLVDVKWGDVFHVDFGSLGAMSFKFA